MKAQHERGATDYCLHIDDQQVRMTQETQALFHGDYFAALSHILKESHKAMKEIDPRATLYFLPTPYWLNAPYDEYAAKLKAGGGLPKGCGMVLCGPLVSSPAYPIAASSARPGTWGLWPAR